jgi:prespore-specific regulator
MGTIRQDAWTADDDLILAEVTMRNIREGGTQLQAFDEVAMKLGRTSAACGFRWNSFVRKNYEAAIQIAKAQRQQRSFEKRGKGRVDAQTDVRYVEQVAETQPAPIVWQESTSSLDATIRYLKHWKQEQHDLTRQVKGMERELRDKDQRILSLERENERLKQSANHVETDYQTMNEDYKALIQIMERARKMAFLHETGEELRPRFKMDANGNLERVE